MRSRGSLLAVLLCGLLASEAWSAPAGAVPRGSGSHPTFSRRPPPERLAMVTLGFFGSYARYDFPKTNEWLQKIVTEIEKTYPGMSLEDLETDIGLSGYLQVLIWEGLGFRLGLERFTGRTTTMEPGGFGPVRADVNGTSSPVALSYSVVKELWVKGLWFTAGAGVDQYRWDMDWKFYRTGEEPLEDWKWRGRGVGGHGFLEAGATVGGLHVLVGGAYHKGVVDMDADLPATTELNPYPRHFEEDMAAFQMYTGLVFSLF